jgi:hypothetical protein
MASALCAEIKANALRGDSDTYDLAGFSPAWLTELVDQCLGQRLPAKDYVACKFVIGGGKKTRSKYDPDMLMHLTIALRAHGLEEDRGASACEMCQGMYKYQHDTDKDLKYLHVFPKLDLVKEDANGSGADGTGTHGTDQSPEFQCVSCTFEEFQELVTMNVPSFSQKRALLKRLKVMVSALEMLEKLLTEQKSLTEQEQAMYDSMVDVGDKVEYLNKELENMIGKGRLTKGEQKQMVEDLTGKMEEIDLMCATAEAEGKQKKKDALVSKKKEVEAKMADIASKKPIVYTMAHEKELNDLRTEITQLAKLENSGKLLKGDELTKLAKKPRLEERLAALEGEDKGWFEDECRDVLFTPSMAKPVAKKKPVGGSKPAGGGWLVTAAKKSGSGKSVEAQKATASNPFAALGDE